MHLDNSAHVCLGENEFNNKKMGNHGKSEFDIV